MSESFTRIASSRLVDEFAIVWIHEVSNFPYVRQEIVHSNRRKGRISWGGKQGYVVGWADLSDTAKRDDGEFYRRVFWLMPHDRLFDPTGVYSHTRGTVPSEAVDPRTVAVGVCGVVTERAKIGEAIL